MTHEGRMARGKEKTGKGIIDSESKYYLDNRPKDTEPEKPKEVKKNARATK